VEGVARVAILNPDILGDIRMSIDEYLSADLPEGHRYELVAGAAKVTPIPEARHDLIVNAFYSHFVFYRERQPKMVGHLSQRLGVIVPHRGTVRQPNLGIYPPDSSPGRSGRTWRDSTPLVVVEVVSPGQEVRDYDDKRRDYWEAGVGEYWIADPQRKTLNVLSRRRSDWVEQTFGASETYRPTALPGLDIPVGELFQDQHAGR